MYNKRKSCVGPIARGMKDMKCKIIKNWNPNPTSRRSFLDLDLESYDAGVGFPSRIETKTVVPIMAKPLVSIRYYFAALSTFMIENKGAREVRACQRRAESE